MKNIFKLFAGSVIVFSLLSTSCTLQGAGNPNVNSSQVSSVCADKVMYAFSVNFAVLGAFKCLSGEYQFAATVNGHGGDQWMENTAVQKYHACNSKPKLFANSATVYYKTYEVDGPDSYGLVFIWFYAPDNNKVIAYRQFAGETCDKIPQILTYENSYFGGSA